MHKKIAIQGQKASFHEVALNLYFKDQASAIYCHSFKDVFKETELNIDCHAAILAIENSIAGSILPNYKLLSESKLQVTGEIYLKINQNLMILPGTKVHQVKEIHSHPMALQQCTNFLESADWKLVETEDTALSARLLSESDSSHIAVIASELAARTYGLEILVPCIQDNADNYTRFLVLQKNSGGSSIKNKASVVFSSPNQPESLARILSEIAFFNINLSKLQSFPGLNENKTVKANSETHASGFFQYYFHADLEFDNVLDFEKAINKIEPISTGLRVLGVYEAGNRNW